MRRLHTWCLLTAMGALSFPATTGLAQPAEDGGESAAGAPAPDSRLEEARGRIATAETLFEQGNYDAALAEFQRAGELLTGHPAHYLVLYNIGKCYEQLFRYAEAMEYYERYLAEGGAGAADAPTVRAKIELLESLLGEILVAVANTEHYEVWVDGRFVGEDTTRVLVPGGSHTIEVRATGFVNGREEIQLPARETREVSFELEALASEYEGLSPGLFWGATGVAAASLVGGLALGLTARSHRNDVDDALAAGGTRGILVATQAERDRIRGLSIGADVLFGAAVVFGATALGLAFATNFGGSDDGDAEDETESAGLQLQLGAVPRRHGGTFWLQGSF